MLRPAFLALTLACILVCAAQPSFAARQDAGAFSAEVPDGWTMSKEDELTRFSAPDESVEIVIQYKRYEKANFQEIISHTVGQTPVKTLAPNIYISEDFAEGHDWGMLAGDGAFASIGVSAPYKDMAAFLAGLKAAKGNAGLAGIFETAAKSEEAVEWLSHAKPHLDGGDSGDQADEDEGTPYTHKTFTAVVPKGWTAEDKGDSVAFTSPDKTAFVIVRVFTLASDDTKAFNKWAREQVKSLQGKDVSGEGSLVEFSTPKGANGMFSQFDKKSLFFLFGGESPQIGEIIRSIGLED